MEGASGKKKIDPEAERLFFERGLDELQERLGYSFGRKELLRQALTHSSYVGETKKGKSYERLEFLGDRVIEVTVCEWLFQNRPNDDEGELSKALGWIADEESLARIGEELGLRRLIRLGQSLRGNGISESVLADAVEAIMCAVYLDGGMNPAAKLVTRLVLKDGKIGAMPEDFLSRSTLEEVCCKLDLDPPIFSHEAQGPEHQKIFRCTVSVGGAIKGEGTGKTKKAAERRASADALEKMRQHSHPSSSPGQLNWSI
jgi:ribonuclease-3